MVAKPFLSGYRCFNGTFSIFMINGNFDKIVSRHTGGASLIRKGIRP